MCDYLHFASGVPSVPVQRRMYLPRLVEARENAAPRPGWCALFTKAWAAVCARSAPLRRAYLASPWPRLYQHPINAATIAVERPYGGEDAIFFMQLAHPETRPLSEIDARLHWFKDRPLGSAAVVRRQLRVAAAPLPIRRLLWWGALNLSGRLRARFFGTFGVTAYPGLGAESLHPIGLLTSTLSYGQVADDGQVDVRVVYDHRTLDGSTIARALAEMERVLEHEILAELRYMERLQAA
jgi:hypothetical protein